MLHSAPATADLINAQQEDRILNITLSALGVDHVISYQLPQGLNLKHDEDIFYLEDENGERCWPNAQDMQSKLSAQTKCITFEVKYVGQAYGKDGSRNAIDRLLKHETLQKIALKKAPEGRRLTLLMLAIQPSNQLITMMNPFAKNKDQSDSRLNSGINKLFNTTEQERISLYEASLIRYFYPEFNKEFKDSFPSTNLKILQDCYDKDFSAVFAEICIDELPFQLCSEKVKPSFYHITKHDLHKDEDRKVFFGF